MFCLARHGGAHEFEIKWGWVRNEVLSQPFAPDLIRFAAAPEGDTNGGRILDEQMMISPKAPLGRFRNSNVSLAPLGLTLQKKAALVELKQDKTTWTPERDIGAP